MATDQVLTQSNDSHVVDHQGRGFATSKPALPRVRASPISGVSGGRRNVTQTAELLTKITQNVDETAVNAVARENEFSRQP